MTADTLLAGLTNAMQWLPDDQRTLIGQLDAILAGHAADDAQRMAFGAVAEIADAATFAGEQRTAAQSVLH